MSRTSNSKSNSVELREVSVAFGSHVALDGVDLAVEPGESLAVIGASGAGKSTLFRALTRDVTVEGEVKIGDRDLHRLPRRELRRLRGSIGTIHQAYNLVPQLSAGVNVALGEVGSMGNLGTLRTFLAGPEKALAGKVEAAMERVGLGGMSGTRTSNLSGGQQQRVAVARLLVQRPGLILADEPFAAVDPVTTERVFDALRELNDDGATLVVSLHDVKIARRLPRVVALKDGRVAYDGDPENLTQDKLDDIYAIDVETKPEPEEEEGPDLSWKIRGQGGVGSH